MPRGTPTADQLAAMQAGRARAKAEKIANGIPLRVSKKDKFKVAVGRPKLYIKGTEKDALDFFPAIRNSLRPLYRNKECDSLCREIASSPTWMNVRITLNRLQEIFDVIEVTKPNKVKVIKEKKKRILTPEHIAAMQAGRRKK
jgi:hypothetical protein